MPPFYDRKDHYYQKAKKAGLASRAVFKFEEIDQRFGLVKRGQKILELGCAPGGWLQYLAQKITSEGRAVGIDLLPVTIKLPSWVTVFQGDATHTELQDEAIQTLGGRADLVISDLSPNLSGIHFRDTHLSLKLAKTVFEITERTLRPGGSMVFKVFPSQELETFKKDLKKHFGPIKTMVPQATRKGSSEVYIIALEFQPAV